MTMLVQFRDSRGPDQWEDFTAHMLVHTGAAGWRRQGVAYVHTADGRQLWVADTADIPGYLDRGARTGDVHVTVIPEERTPEADRPALCVRCATVLHLDDAVLCDDCKAGL